VLVADPRSRVDDAVVDVVDAGHRAGEDPRVAEVAAHHLDVETFDGGQRAARTGQNAHSLS
jgi:hypothetical protein